MKILVAVKRVIDYNVQIRVKEDGTGVHTDNVKMSTNPPDDNAIEEAVKIKESGKATEVIAVTVGEEKSQETVRKALAVGADRGIHVKVEGIIEPLAVSKVLQKIVASCIFPKLSIFNFWPVVASSGLTIPIAIDLFNLKPKSPPVALPTTLPF